MGNSQDKPSKPLRKALSVPNTHDLPPDAPVLVKEKSRSSQRLNQPSGKNSKSGKSGKKSKHNAGVEQELQIPYSDAVFLPEFPLRGDVEELDYDVIEVIAKGAYGNVIKVQREDEKRFYAVKVLDKDQILHDGAVNQCKDEASIQSMAGNHPFVVKAHEYWQSYRNLYIVLDYVPHGDMFTLWTFHGCFPEELVRLYIAEMAMVIEYLHDSCVVYRDVKMENILFNAKGHIRLTDFGLAKRLQRGEQTRTVCGTLQYMAPEVLSVYPYGHPADWWSIGILMYTMLVGKYPVDGIDNHTRMAQKVFECDYLLPGNISNAAQDVVNRILTKSPHKRLCDLDRLQDLYFFQDLIFSDLIDCNVWAVKMLNLGRINPVDVVPLDFFPMTGASWAPQLLTHEEQRQFDQFDDTNEAVARGNHRDDRHSNSYDYYRRSDYDDYHRSDSYDSYSPRQQRDEPDRYDSHHPNRHRPSDPYSSYEQNEESSNKAYTQQQYHSENRYEDFSRQSHHRQQHQSHYNHEQEYSRERPAPEMRNNRNTTRPHSSHQNRARNVRDSVETRDTDNSFQRERGGSTASSSKNSLSHYSLSSHEATLSIQGKNNGPLPTQDYMAPSHSSINSSERQRSDSAVESLPSPAMYMSMDGHRSGSFSQSNDLREMSLGHSSHDSEYVAPSLPKNPPPTTLSSASSNPPSITLNPGVKLVEAAPTITLPPSANQQKVANSNNVSVYADVKGRPKVKAQQSLPSPLYLQSPIADVKDYKGLEESQIQLVTSPVIKSPPPQQIASNPKPKIPPAPPPKPVISKQPVKPAIAPVPAVRKSFNAKKKFTPNDKVASHQMPSKSPHPKTFPGLPLEALHTPGNSSVSLSGSGNAEKPRPVPKPRHNVNRPTYGNDENFNDLGKISPNLQIDMNQEVHSSNPVSPSDDSFQWNLPTSSVPSFV